METPDCRAENVYTAGEILIEHRSSNLGVAHRTHPGTGQRLLLTSTRHSRQQAVESPDIQDLIDVTRDFAEQTDGMAVELYVEGRVPAVTHNGWQYPGERLPGIRTDDLADAVRQHGDVGAMACLGVEYGFHIQSLDDDRQIIQQLEGADFEVEDIVRYLLFRAIPQWARTESRPPLGDYLEQNVIQRYRALMGPTWAGFSISVHDAMSMSHATLNSVSSMSPDEVSYFLDASIGHMYGIRPPGDGTKLSSVMQVSEAFNLRRDKHYARVLNKGWGIPGVPHRIAAIGRYHLGIVARELAAL